MTKRLFQTDSYLKEFSATVTGIVREKNAIILDQTAFYPGGGGQVFDVGMIKFNDDDLGFQRAKTVKGDIVHMLKEGTPLPPVGCQINGKIDWERRYKVMRTHSAMHVLCGTIFRDYGALVTGGDMEPLKGRMDFEFENLTRDLVAIIEKAINIEIEKAHPIRVAIHTREEALKIPDLIRTKINLLPEYVSEVRTIEIVGLDLQADGGTHVRDTSEIGPVRIVDYKSKGRINKRLYIALDAA